MPTTKYFVEFYVNHTELVHTREFPTMLLRTMFVISFEANGLGHIIHEWVVEDGGAA